MIENLFGIPVWYDLVDPNTYNKDQLITTIKNNYEKNPERNRWSDFCKMHHGYHDFDNEEYEPLNLNILKVVYQNKINKFASEVLGDISGVRCNLEIVNYTAMESGGHMTRHDHVETSTSFVGVHYLKFKAGQHSNIRYWNPHTLFTMLPGYDQIYHKLGICNKFFSHPVQEDMITIYPSFLEHDIPLQGETDSLRLSIVFNLKIDSDTSDD